MYSANEGAMTESYILNLLANLVSHPSKIIRVHIFRIRDLPILALLRSC